jgi:hypothetical protein
MHAAGFVVRIDWVYYKPFGVSPHAGGMFLYPTLIKVCVHVR